MKNSPFFIDMEYLSYFLLGNRLCLLELISCADRKRSILLIELMTAMSSDVAFGNC